ncbi:hypothetical protein A3L09_09810 [Thermococcus profundus]|uniref:PEGA domain-containing protein n=1 Tax=Thermococcus profundus TaxID=49899 RepID=A0A2Z2MNN0_THEPR|nr:PEGA domain-containing protein [Thermococcus profundus]ASJ03528.1 hypothetical protein A3L09_09810 [Thermococcus profundus]
MRKKVIILILATFLMGSLVSSQTEVAAESTHHWVKSYGGSNQDGARAVALADNGDIVLAGWTYSFGISNVDAWVLRLDEDGNIKWQKTYGGNERDEAYMVAIAPNGDIVIIGHTISFGAGDVDVWVLRLDEKGNVKWQKTYGGNERDGAYAVAIADNGDIIVAGYTYSFSTGKVDSWVLRLDGSGNIKWQRAYNERESCVANAIVVALNGDIIVAGSYKGDIWVLRLDENGNVKWEKTLGGDGWERAYAVALAPNEDIIVAGYTESFSAGYSDVWVLRLDEDGNIKWQKSYGAWGGEEARAVALADNGDIVIAGGTGSFEASSMDVWVLDLDEMGNIKWQKNYGGWDWEEAYGVSLAPNGDIITSGSTHSYGSNHDVWVLRLPLSGELPGCDFCRDTNAEPRTTTAQITTPTPNVETTDAQITDSNAQIVDSNAQVQVQYWDESYLQVTSFPQGAEVYVNETYQGVTPLNLTLTPGTYQIMLSEEKYENYTRTVTLAPLKTATIIAQLTPKPATLSITSDLSGAKVHINGTYIGTTPLNLTIYPGTYHIKLSKQGYADYIKIVTIKPLQTAVIKAELRAKPVTFAINSDPSEAKVYVNGTHRGTTPLSLSLNPGTYRIDLSKEGYWSYSTTITITPGSAPTINVTLTPKPATLTILSEPSGTSVYIDGSYKGATPLTLNLTHGIHELRLEKDGYKGVQEALTLNPGESRSLDLKLEPLPVTLSITATPEMAVVYVNNEYQGVTPLKLSLFPGTYEVKIAKDEYEALTQTVALNPGESTTLNVTLTPLFGFLRVYCNVEGAEVYVDNVKVGETPLEGYKLPAGEHTVKVKKAGHRDFMQAVAIKPGETQTVNVTLESVQTTSSSERRGVCGPGVLILLSLPPLLMRKLRK